MSSSKTLYLIDSINNTPINSSCHITELMPYIEKISNIKVVHYNLDLNNIIVGINEINDKADIVFILHDFTLWNRGNFDVDYKHFEHFICSIWSNKNIFVFPTEMASSGLLKSQFKNNSKLMTKIVVGSESFRKMFMKIDTGISISNNRIKLISMPTEPFQFTDNTVQKKNLKLKQKVLYTPGLIHPKKDYISLLSNFQNLLLKNKNLLYVLSLKSHTTISPTITWNEFDKLQDYVEDHNLQEYVRLSLDKTNRSDYIGMMRLADLIVFPQDNSLDMYNGCMIDALAMGKAIVTPENPFSEDLVKKTSILLYKYKDEGSFFDACTVILDNKDFRDILQQHNYEYGQNLSYPKIAQQYVNQIKRFKFN